jgi:HEAT repeat protein
MRFPTLDAFSFWLGFAAALLVALGLYRFRQRLAAARQRLVGALAAGRDFFTSGTERLVREDTLRYAQTAHLAGTLLALDDLLLPPRVLPLPVPYDPASPPPDFDINSAIPVLPEWPDLAAIYRAPGLTPAEALTGNTNLLVIGRPGTGKTTLLAHIASRVALDDLTMFGQTCTPIFVHAADLALPQPPGADVELPLIAAAQARASALTGPRLPRHLRQRLRDGRCAILLDGLDELTPAEVAEVAAWLGQLVAAHKQHRLVVVAGTAGYGPLLRLGLSPAQIVPYGRDDYRALIRKWGTAWETLVRARRRRGASDTDAELIMGWLGTGNQGRSIFEVTLKIWAAFAGDARGKRPVDWLEAYVLRHGVKPNGQQALGRLAVLLFEREATGSPLFWAEAVAMINALLPGPGGKLDGEDFLADMVERRLLARHRDRISFRHGLSAAYCAGQAAANEPTQVTPGATTAWVNALYFYAALGELTPTVAQRLSLAPDLLHSDLMAAARWVRDAPAGARWRPEVLRRLTRLLVDPEQPRTLRLSALGAFVAANDPDAAALFRRGLADDNPDLRWMACLGLGSLSEVGATVAIASHFTDAQREVRWAAALALSAMDNETATMALGQGLLVGDDDLRRACAEALARLPEEGHPMLREAIGHAEVSVRRAAVYGLAATRADWALLILQQVQHTEQQWFVRSAIQDVLAQRTEPGRGMPKAYSDPAATGWLIAWAAQQGIGVPPGRGAYEVLLRALNEGDDNTRHAAADLLSVLDDPTASLSLYPLLRETSRQLREVAFSALARIAAGTGQRLAAQP